MFPPSHVRGVHVHPATGPHLAVHCRDARTTPALLADSAPSDAAPGPRALPILWIRPPCDAWPLPGVRGRADVRETEAVGSKRQNRIRLQLVELSDLIGDRKDLSRGHDPGNHTDASPPLVRYKFRPWAPFT